MRLIDADALKVEIASLVVGGELRIYEVMPRSGNDWVDGISSAYREIDDAPTIEERPKGKWINEYVEDMGVKTLVCSECHYPMGQVRDCFCANCGADMRGNE